jgi:hypothetical protein
MSSVVEKIVKRKAWPCELPNGETIHVRALTRGEIKTYNALGEPANDNYFIGCCLVDEAGQQIIARTDGETIEAYSARCEVVADLFDAGAIVAVIEAVAKASKPPKPETAAKN